VISAASAWLVWSFQSQAQALGLSLNSSSMLSGVPLLSTGIGVEPVVSTPMPIIWLSSKPLVFFFASAIAALTVTSMPLT